MRDVIRWLYIPPLPPHSVLPSMYYAFRRRCYSRIRERVIPLLHSWPGSISFISTSTLRTVNSLSVMTLYLQIEKFKSFVNCCFSTCLWMPSEKLFNSSTCNRRSLNNSLVYTEHNSSDVKNQDRYLWAFLAVDW